MADRSRAYLYQEFSDGERPSGDNFRDLIDSAINKEDDDIRLDANNNLKLPNGLLVGDATTGQKGTLRLKSGQLELFDGAAWSSVGGSGGTFTDLGGGDVGYSGGNVVIGEATTAVSGQRLAVELKPGEKNEHVLLGHLAVYASSDGVAAYVSHEDFASNDQMFALRQDRKGNTTVNGKGNTTVNAGKGAKLVLSQEGNERIRVATTGNLALLPKEAVSVEGDVTIGSGTDKQNITLYGDAIKTGSAEWIQKNSDARVKRDVESLDLGLAEICRLNPVYYKYNGKGCTVDDGKEQIGLIAQEVGKVLPNAVLKAGVGESDDGEEYLTYDPSCLRFLMINAIRELSQKVERLEAQLAAVAK